MKKLIVNIPIIILALILTDAQVRAQNFKAEQYVQNASIELKGSIERVFPLFTVSGEKHWAQDWNPDLIFPTSERCRKALFFRHRTIYTGCHP
jgi:hypothetical protein